MLLTKAAVCSLILVFAFGKVTRGDGCRTLYFEPEVQGSALTNHVFKSFHVERDSACEPNCFAEDDCMSFNIGPLVDGKHLCELSNSDHNIHPDDLIRRKGFIYQPTRNACSRDKCSGNMMCQNGFTDKGFRCVCNKGYVGQHCNQVFPTVTVFPIAAIIEEKSDVTFSCDASGQPKPDITWTKSQGSLPSSRTITSEGDLTIRNVITDDSGSYKCTATNAAGIKSSSVKLQVNSALEFTIKPPSFVKLYMGQTLNVSCSVSSDPLSTVSWIYYGANPLLPGICIDTSQTLVIQSVDSSNDGNYACVAQTIHGTINTSFTVQVVFPETCSRVKTIMSDESGDYTIDPDGAQSVPPFTVFCNMTDKGGVGVTVISHDTEGRTHVNGFEEPGSYIRNVSYVGYNFLQLQSLTEASTNCEQFISYECHNSRLLDRRTAWWVSRRGAAKWRWGGSSTTYQCACGETKSCDDPNEECNCDKNDDAWREDSGLLTNKNHLPVSQLRFGDTGHNNEEGYHTLGKLQCYGLA